MHLDSTGSIDSATKRLWREQIAYLELSPLERSHALHRTPIFWSPPVNNGSKYATSDHIAAFLVVALQWPRSVALITVGENQIPRIPGLAFSQIMPTFRVRPIQMLNIVAHTCMGLVFSQ